MDKNISNENQDPNSYDNQSYPAHRLVSDDTSVALRILLSILKRPWLLILTMLVVFVPSIFYFYNQVPLYRSSATVALAIPKFRFSFVTSQELPLGSSEADEEYYFTILKSSSYYEDVVKRITQIKPLNADSLLREISRNGGLTFERKPRVNGYIYIVATSQYPDFAELLCKMGLESFKQISVDIRRSEGINLSQFVDNQLAQLNDNLAELENEIQIFLRDRKLTIDDVVNGVDSELRTLQRNLSEAQAARDLAKLQINAYSQQIDKRLGEYLTEKSSVGDEQRILDLRRQLESVNVSLSEVSESNSDSAAFRVFQTERRRLLSEMIQSINREQVSAMGNGKSRQVSWKTLDNELEKWLMEYENAQVRCMYFDTAINNFIDTHPNLPADILEYLNLSRSKSVLERTIDILIGQRERIRMKMASELGGISVLDEPNFPRYPISQKRSMKLFVVFILSFVLGIGLAFIIDVFDDTIQNEKEVQTRYNLTLYGSVPVLTASGSFAKLYSKQGGGGQYPAKNNGANPVQLNYYPENSPVAEAYRSIKTAIKFTARDRQKKVFVISSPVAGDGKSITTYNLSISLAQGGERILLIDADLRRSTQHKLFGIPRKPGLTDYLEGKESIESITKKHYSDKVRNLWFIPAGRRMNNPAEIVSSNAMSNFLKEVTPLFDFILIDTPPIMPCMDSRNLATMTGGMILVVRAESTKSSIIEHSLNLCQRLDVEVLGVIVNHASFRYGYGYYYIYNKYNPDGYYYTDYQHYHTNDTDNDDEVPGNSRRVHSSRSSNETG